MSSSWPPVPVVVLVSAPDDAGVPAVVVVAAVAPDAAAFCRFRSDSSSDP